MRKDLSVWQLAGFTFTAVLGTLLHFLYDLTKVPAFTAFSAVNESTWEHMKILFFPMLVFAFIQSAFTGKSYPDFWWIKLAGIALALALVPTLFYTYNGAFGKSPDWFNVLVFFLAAGAGYLLEYLLFKRENQTGKLQFLALLILGAIAFLFVFFTYFPPYVPLFQDPVTGGYGWIESL